MTRKEFLEKLKEALENDLSGRIVQENVNYYESYIMEEAGKGRPESEVIDELGDPWVIARSIIDMAEGEMGGQSAGQAGGQSSGRDGYSGSYGGSSGGGRQERPGRYGRNAGESGHIHVFSTDSWWKKLLLILGVIGVVLIVIAVIGGVFSLLAPLIVPVLCLVLIFRMLNGRRR